MMTIELAKEPSIPADASLSGTSNQRIPELDGLRGAAILLVVLCHYIASAEHMPLGFFLHRLFQALAIGWSGVDLFFVLSGFLIGGILLESRESPRYFQTFYLRRVHRILPIYYSWLLLYGIFRFTAGYFSPGWSLLSSSDYEGISGYIVFIQNCFYFRPRLEWIWLGATWSLAVEEQFYLVAPPLIRLFSLRSLTVVLTAAVLLAPFLRFVIFHFAPEHSFLVTFAMPCRADTLGLGILAAIGWRDAKFRAYLASHPRFLYWTSLALALGAAALGWWLVHPVSLVTATVGYSWLALFYCSLMLLLLAEPGCFLGRMMRLKPLIALGTISYCIYIIHVPIDYLAHRFILHGEPQIYDLTGVLVTIFAAILTWIIASISWKWFEKPLIRRGHRFIYG